MPPIWNVGAPVFGTGVAPAKVNVADSAPMVFGQNLTIRVPVLPAVTEPGPLTYEKSAALGPVIVGAMPDDQSILPVLVTVRLMFLQSSVSTVGFGLSVESITLPPKPPKANDMPGVKGSVPDAP